MARKVGELERAVLAVYQQIDEATPAIHKQTTGKGGSSTAESPWVKLRRAGCQLVLAGVELGDHCRQAAGITKPGPIQESLGDDALQSIRATVPRRGTAGGNGTQETDRLLAAAKAVESRLAGIANIREEIEWVASNLHRDDPDVAKAPSIAAINMLADVRTDNALRRDFWNLIWSKRLSPGERKPRQTAFDDEEREAAEDAAVDEEALKRRLGMVGDDEGS
jgi:hypothetical protein